MIRRDYLLRQIEQFVATLTRIVGLTKNEQWPEAATATDDEFRRLTGMAALEVLRMSETELLARLIEGEPASGVEAKAFMLTTLLKTKGDLLAGQERWEDSRAYYLKGLHLLLGTVSRSEITERPDFAPTVEAFLTGLRDSPLPLETGGLLMRHYEQTREFAKAEDTLFGILDAAPTSAKLLDFGKLFYQRLLGLSDRVLAEGNLPRPEAQAGLAELEKRRANLSGTADGGG